MAIAVGLILGLLTLGLLKHLNRLDNPKLFACFLAVIALIYPIFAVIAGDLTALIWHSGFAAVFIFWAWLGYRRGLFYLGIAILFHGNFDLYQSTRDHLETGPEWYPLFCATYDYVIGIALMYIYYPSKDPQT